MAVASLSSDYDALFRQNYRHLVYYTRTHGVAVQDAEDCVSRLFVALIEKDVLSTYDPHLITFHAGRQTPTSSRALIMSMYKLYLRGYKEQMALERYREPLLCDRVMTDTEQPWIDTNAPTLDPDDIVLAERVADYFADQPMGATLQIVFDAALDAVDKGRLNKTMLGKSLSMKKPALESNLRYMEKNLRKALA